MQLIAVLGATPTAHALARHRDERGRYWLHPVPHASVEQAVPALASLGFAGALVFGADARRDAARVATRTAHHVGPDGGDVVTVVGDATLVDTVGDAAVVDGLRHAGWDPRGARVIAVGDDAGTTSLLAELAAAGAAELTVVGRDAPAAEHALPALPAGARGAALATRDPALPDLLARADAVVRGEDLLAPQGAWFGPHLTLVDVAPDLDADWRRAARTAGAATVPWADVEAHRVAAAVQAVLGERVDAAPFLDVLHAT
ncbi:MAG: hypothetical protein RI554_05050 [Trueperaceae bacterium]|nr:hypothetical protein [Trueperaceae bacterium]